MFMKKIYALIAAIIVLAAASVAIIVNAGKPDSFFEANVAALAQTESVDVKQCFVNGSEGPWEYALFCDRRTSTSTFYSCPSMETYGYKSSNLYCLK